MEQIPQITTEQALQNMEEVIRFAMAGGIFKTFQELDAARMSLHVIATDYRTLKNKSDGSQKEIRQELGKQAAENQNGKEKQSA